MRRTRTIAAAAIVVVVLVALSGAFFKSGRENRVAEAPASAVAPEQPVVVQPIPAPAVPPQMVPVPPTPATDGSENAEDPEPKPGTTSAGKTAGNAQSIRKKYTIGNAFKPGTNGGNAYGYSGTGNSAYPAVAAPEPVDPVEEAVRVQARQANSSIEVQTNMQVGARYEARLLVQRGEAASARSFMAKTLEPTVFDQDIEVTQEAAARATSPTLDITLTSPEWQTIRTNAPAIWTWTVVPTVEGAASMTITLSQKVMVDGEERIVTVEHYPQSIQVAIGFWSGVWRDVGDPATFLIDKWGSLVAIFGSLAVAAAAVSAFGRRVWRRASAGSPPPSDGVPTNANGGSTAASPATPDQPRPTRAGNGQTEPPPPP